MKILIACDMEGISGVLNWDHVNPSHAEYQRFRRLMTAEANAAIRGAFAGGANEVVVADGHWDCSNVLIEELDPRARLNGGTPSPFSMVAGIDESVDGACFIGYHARAGSHNAILDHTWSDTRVANLWLNDTLVGECGLNAAVCGHFGAPVLLVAGDQTVCQEATLLLGAVETVITKRASGRNAAECLPPAVAQERIEAAAARAVARLARGEAPAPFILTPPITVRVEFKTSEMGDKAALLPYVRRLDGRLIEFTAPSMTAAYQSFRATVTMARV